MCMYLFKEAKELSHLWSLMVALFVTGQTFFYPLLSSHCTFFLCQPVIFCLFVLNGTLNGVGKLYRLSIYSTDNS